MSEKDRLTDINLVSTCMYCGKEDGGGHEYSCPLHPKNCRVEEIDMSLVSEEVYDYTPDQDFIYVYPGSDGPYRCPVCEGKGIVSQGFYSLKEVFSSHNTAEETCRSCEGKGYVWKE